MESLERSSNAVWDRCGSPTVVFVVVVVFFRLFLDGFLRSSAI